MVNIRARMDPVFRDLHGGFFTEYQKLSAQGVTLMGWADPFYPDPSIPEHVKQATIQSIREGKSHYTVPIGTAEIRGEIAKKLKRFNGLDIDPETEICVSPGSDIALLFVMRPFLVPGEDEEVLVPDPGYALNFLNCRLAGGRCIRVPLSEASAFDLDIEELERRVTARTKLLLLTHPNNPTTRIYSRETLIRLANFIERHDLVALVDQAFEEQVFDGREYVTFASLEGMFGRTVTIFTLSKGMALCGFRVAYLVAARDLMDVYHGYACNMLSPANTFAQDGAIAALRDDAFVDDYKGEMERRRDFAYEIFNSIPKVRCLKPESSCFAWVNISNLGTSQDIVDYLIRDARVAVNPGPVFGECGEGYIRVVFGSLKNSDLCRRALLRIKESLTKLARQARS